MKPQPVSREELERLVDGAHHDPHSILGAHPHDGATTIRVLRPHARAVTVVLPGERFPMHQEIPGVWWCVVPGSGTPDYRIDVQYDADPVPADDPYHYWPFVGEVDLHLLAEGRHEQMWQQLGAHVHRFDSGFGPVVGTAFAVWAPNALGVRVIGDFNYWDGAAHPMRSLGGSGIWELFIPGVQAGARYKFQILGRDGMWRDKADPVAAYAEQPPATASIVYESTYSWGDASWLDQRARTDPHTRPMSIYEVHLPSWRAGLGYRELARELVDYVTESGFTHVEFLPVSEHPYGPSWGYQVSGYFAPTARLGDPDDFRYLVDRLHQAGIAVIIDWVPAHFPKDEWALARFDGTCLYEHPDPQRGEHPDWGTYVFDFGRREVRNFLVSNAVYWLEEFHIDGLRVDAVASMLYLDYSRDTGQWSPNEFGGRENLDAVRFLQEMNATVYKRVPGAVTIAEESTAWPGVTTPTYAGGLGFGFKWNMGWMHDSLDYMKRDPIHRSFHHNDMTFSMMYAYSERFILPLSHDEVVHGKGSLIARMPGDRWQALANLRAYLAFMWAHPGKKLLFMGGEFAQSDEWSSERSLDWWLMQFAEHEGMWRTVRDLNRAYRDYPALWERDHEATGFEWIDAEAAGDNTFSFLRWDKSGGCVAVVVNFSPVVRSDVRIGLPRGGLWTEIVNTDASIYGGSGAGNNGAVQGVDQPWAGRQWSASITIPPLAACYFASTA
jgi:1,4-alpha-glucan branching enzyme